MPRHRRGARVADRLPCDPPLFRTSRRGLGAAGAPHPNPNPDPKPKPKPNPNPNPSPNPNRNANPNPNPNPNPWSGALQACRNVSLFGLSTGDPCAPFHYFDPPPSPCSLAVPERCGSVVTAWSWRLVHDSIAPVRREARSRLATAWRACARASHPQSHRCRCHLLRPPRYDHPFHWFEREHALYRGWMQGKVPGGRTLTIHS